MPILRAFGPVYRRHPKLLSAAVVTTLIAAYFAVRLISQVVYWSQHHQEPIQPWMTIGYVGHSWGINPRAIDEAAGLPKPIDHPLTLQEIATQRGVPVATIIKQVEATVTELKAAQK